ncbi:MAG: asparagine--tRNA ligase [Bacteroidota bacterium]|nr:asparagine--tRNA ligase [Bacteroidota bacterium]
MKRQRISDLLARPEAGGDVDIAGWVRTKRDSKEIVFLNVNDGSNLAGIQVVVPRDAACFEDARKLTTGASVAVSGRLVDSPGGKQRFEILASGLRIYGLADPATYPIQKKKITLEYLREVAHLRPRTNTFGAVFRVRNTAADAVHRFFQERGFVWIHTPIITSADAEGAGELFRVTVLDPASPPRMDDGRVDYREDFFGRETYLTVSGQLAVENFCSALGNVYTFGPTFRAENSNTTRHLAEFWMIEPEMAFADIHDDMDLAEEFLKYIIAVVLRDRAEDMSFLAERYDPELLPRLEHILASTFARITYTEAVEILERSGRPFQFPVRWGMDLQTEHERYLCEEHFMGPVIVTDYPMEIKAFYMKQNDDGKTVRAMDILFPGVGEIVGGSQREDDLEKLVSRMRALGMREETYWWYLDLRRYGTHPHCGFGLGFERLVQFLTGMSNIRDVIPFPRTPKNADF